MDDDSGKSTNMATTTAADELPDDIKGWVSGHAKFSSG